MILRARPPFDFAKSLASIESFAPSCGEQRCDADRLRKAFEIDGHAVLATVYAIDETSVDVWLDADVELTQPQCDAAYDRVAFYLSLDDAIVRSRIARGVYQVKFPTVFESACWAILSQRLSIPIARRIKERLRDAFGTSIVRDGITYRAFPSPQRLSAASEADLRSLRVPEPKIRYLRSAIEAFTRVDETRLRNAPVDEMQRWLRAIGAISARPSEVPALFPSISRV